MSLDVNWLFHFHSISLNFFCFSKLNAPTFFKYFKSDTGFVLCRRLDPHFLVTIHNTVNSRHTTMLDKIDRVTIATVYLTKRLGS